VPVPGHRPAGEPGREPPRRLVQGEVGTRLEQAVGEVHGEPRLRSASNAECGIRIAESGPTRQYQTPGPVSAVFYSAFRIPHSAFCQARTIFSRPARTPRVALRVSTTSRAWRTTKS